MKNITKTKKLLILALSFCLVVCAFIAFIPQMFTAKATTPSQFKMADGAEIRQSDYKVDDKDTSGIKFSASISRDYFEELAGTDATEPNFEFGMLIGKGDFDPETAKQTLIDNIDNPKVKHQATYYDLTSTEFKFSFAIYGITENEAEFSAVAYIIPNGETTPVYADVTVGKNVRSLYDVALAYGIDAHNDAVPEEPAKLAYAHSIVKPIYTEEEFLTIASAKTTYVLMDNIDLTVNGFETPDADSDVAWTEVRIDGVNDDNAISIFDDFTGVLDGNGYKVTVLNTKAIPTWKHEQDVDSSGIFSGLFYRIVSGAVIKNTVFDIQVSEFTSRYPDGGWLLCNTLQGALENCYIKAKYTGDTSKARNVYCIGYVADTTTTKMENVIFDLADSKLNHVVRNQNDADLDTSKVMVTGSQTANSGTFEVNNFTDAAELIHTNTIISATGNKSCNFVKDGNDLKLLDKVACSSVINVSSVDDFMTIDKGSKYATYNLTKSLTINVDGVGSVVNEADVCWSRYHTWDYYIYLFYEFKATFNGNGYTVKIFSETSLDSYPSAAYGSTGTFNFTGIFHQIQEGATVKNTVFDIQLKGWKEYNKRNVLFCNTLKGNLQNCYLKATYDDTDVEAITVSYIGTIPNTTTVAPTVEYVIFDFTNVNMKYINRDQQNTSFVANNCIAVGTTKYFYDLTYSRTGVKWIDGKIYADYSALIAANDIIGNSEHTTCAFTKVGSEIQLCGKTVLTNTGFPVIGA